MSDSFETDRTRTSVGRTPSDSPTMPTPEAISGYTILGKLGEGGMGIVYEAEQLNPRRRVALKVVRGAFVDELHLRMFRREAETLGRLKHPNIAAIYEAGRTAEGQHFFAMELVEGASLDVYLRRRPDPVTRAELVLRLGLFRKICDAVQYAHQRGVIHRDLKPSNMIVADTADAGGVPDIKVLDFGLARITDGDVRATMQSEVGAIKGTLQYMSPEQARGDSAEIDLRTDVYALGMILYQMLSGQLPYDLSRTSVVEALRTVCEVSPRPLRDAMPRAHRVDADLETIVAHALEKEPDRRYATAAELAADVGRYLDSQPIQARPASTLYQLRKAIARNRVPSLLAACVLLLIVGSAITMGVLLRRAQLAEAKAHANFSVARNAVDQYLNRVAESPDLKARGLETLRRSLLSTAEQFYEKLAVQGGDTPELRADLGRAQSRLATIYDAIGQSSAAEQAYQRSIGVLVGVAPAGSPNGDLAAARADYGMFLTHHGRFAEAESTFRLALAETRDPYQLGTLSDRMGILLGRAGRSAPAESAYRRGIALREEVSAKSPSFENRYPLVESYNNLGMLYATTGRPAAAESLFRKAVVLITRLAPERPEDPIAQAAVAASHGNLAGALVLLGRFDEARAEYRTELAMREKLANEHPRVIDYQLEQASAYTNLGELETRTGRAAEALLWLTRSIATLQALLAIEPKQDVGRYYLSYTYGWQARALKALGRRSDALAAWDHAIAFDDRHDPALLAERAKTANATRD